MAIVEGSLNIEARAVQEGDAVRQKHGDASTQLRAGCSRQPALQQQNGLESADWPLSDIPIVLSRKGVALHSRSAVSAASKLM